MTSRNVIVNIRAGTTQYVRAVKKASTATVGLNTSLASVGKAAKFGAAGAAVAVAAIGAAAVKVGIEAAQAFATFEKSIAQIEGLVGVPKEELDGMVDTLKDLSVETARGPQELAEALFFITSAGLEGEAAMEALEVSAKAATAGLGDTATIADVVTSAVNAYGDTMEGAAVATDVLVATVREGKADATSLASAMGRVIPIASQMGISFDQVGAAIAAMTRVGLDANEAGTALRGVMSSLLKPTTDAERVLNKMGLSAAGLRQQIKDEGLFTTLEELSGAFEGNAEATTAVFGNVRALTGVLSLMGSNAEATKEIFGELADSTGSLDTAFGVAADTGAFAFEQAKTRIETALLEVGQEILPKLAEAVDAIAPHIPNLVAGFGDLAIVMTDIGTQIIPALAQGLQDLPNLMRASQIGVINMKEAYLDANDALGQVIFFWKDVGTSFSNADDRLRSFLGTQIKVSNALRDGDDPIKTAALAMQELTRTQNAAPAQLDEIRNQLGLTNDQWGQAAKLLLQNAELYGLTAGEIGHMTAVTEEARATYSREQAARDRSSQSLHEFEASLGKVVKPAEDVQEVIEEQITPLDNYRAALELAEEANYSLADAMLSMVNPTFKAVKAVAAVDKAYAELAEVQGDAEASAKDVALAELGIVEAELKAQAALDNLGFDPTNVEGSLQAIELSLGLGREGAIELLETLGVLDGMSVETILEIQGRLTGALAGAVGNGEALHVSGARAGGGPVKKGHTYRVGEEGEELFTATQNGMIIPNGGFGTSSNTSSATLNFYIEKGTAMADIQTALVTSGVTDLIDLDRAAL